MYPFKYYNFSGKTNSYKTLLFYGMQLVASVSFISEETLTDCCIKLKDHMTLTSSSCSRLPFNMHAYYILNYRFEKVEIQIRCDYKRLTFDTMLR